MKECKTAKLVGIVTGTPSKIPDWKQKYGIEDKNIYNYENLHEIKNNPDIDRCAKTCESIYQQIITHYYGLTS
jgi:hypothetical protein